MNTQHLLTPELAAVIAQLPVTPINRDSLAAVRAARAQQAAAFLPLLPAFPHIGVSEHRVPGSGASPDVRVLVYRPIGSEHALPVLLWMHGGGYVSGQADWDSFLINPLITAVGCCVVSVDYRLAPETPFPGAIEDCYAALKWLYDGAESLQIDPRRIAVGGLSAGAGLAASLGLLARDRGEVPVAFQLLLQPMLDDRQADASYSHPFAGEYIWRKEYNAFGWSALLGHAAGVDGVSPYAAAARAETLAGSPPTFINVGTLDLFVEENMEYARRLIRAGVPTELHIYPGACHGFQVLAPASPLAQDNDRDVCAALRQAFGRSAAPKVSASHDAA